MATQSNKNDQILDSLYLGGTIEIDKNQLLKQGFDFSEAYLDKDGVSSFDKDDLQFPFKDFVCGKYFVKTTGELKGVQFPYECLKFRIIRVDFNDLLNILEKSIELRRNRKYWSGEAWARTNDSAMADPEIASSFNQKVVSNEATIQLHISTLGDMISSLQKTKTYLEEINTRMQDESENAEYWL